MSRSAATAVVNAYADALGDMLAGIEPTPAHYRALTARVSLAWRQVREATARWENCSMTIDEFGAVADRYVRVIEAASRSLAGCPSPRSIHPADGLLRAMLAVSERLDVIVPRELEPMFAH